ncbi:MAG: hypothetical protein J3K34DRAFT_381840 [Monoraphidium minutum]|nr:MAG: hypothetical protein J3K34DRAFT_381840 [Monoraphidium minutum]
MEDEDEVLSTLYIHKCAHIYKIPPRPAAGGHRSGEWLVADKIFSGRLRVVARGDLAEVRLEEANGDLFAMCPVAHGRRGVAVEAVADSSRYFVLRVVDPGSGRHAFLGLGFDERGDAFDFTAALADHERRAQREIDAAAAAVAAAGGGGAAGAGSSGGGAAGGGVEAAAVLYRHQDLGLKEGQTIRRAPAHACALAGCHQMARACGGTCVTAGAGPGRMPRARGAAAPCVPPAPAHMQSRKAGWS